MKLNNETCRFLSFFSLVILNMFERLQFTLFFNRIIRNIRFIKRVERAERREVIYPHENIFIPARGIIREGGR